MKKALLTSLSTCLLFACFMTSLAADPAKTSIAGIYRLDRFDVQVTYSVAKQACEDRHSWLVEIKDQDMSDAVTALISGATANRFYIGLTCAPNNDRTDCTWNDGTSLAYQHWASGEGTNPAEDCTIAVGDFGGKWADVNCGNPYNYICQSFSDPANSSIVGIYRLDRFDVQVIYSVAKKACEDRNSWLVEIKDQDMSEGVTALMSGATANQFYIGLTCASNSDPTDCTWNDGTSLGYENWGGSEGANAAEDCTIAVRNNGGKWADVNCDNTYNYICQSDGFFQRGNCKYLINYDELKTSNGGNSTCSGLGGSLTMVKDQETHDFLVESAKSIYDVTSDVILWIGGKKDQSVWKWFDSTTIPLSTDEGFSKWSTGRPDDLGDCLVMTTYNNRQSNGGQQWDDFDWGDKTCSAKQGYTCEIPVSYPCESFNTNGGTCYSVGCQRVYSCKVGVDGDNCENDPCEPNPCNNRGTCTRTSLSPYYQCSCEEAYNGTDCENPIFFQNGNCKYHINYNQMKTSDDGNSTCTNLGGSLTMVKDQETHDFLVDSAKSIYDVTSVLKISIGGTKDTEWRWLDSTRIPMSSDEGFSAWASGRPDDNGNCVLMTTWYSANKNNGSWSDMNWADSDCAASQGYTCEVPVSDSCQSCKATGTCSFSIGCQCVCHAGYFGENCDEDLIEISPVVNEMTVIKGNRATLEISITTFDENPATTVEAYEPNNLTPFQTKTIDGNGNVSFTIEPDESSDGEFTFIASPPSNAYKKETYINITVHVNVTISSLSPTTMSSPVTIGASFSNCTAYGIPTPSVTWYRDDIPVPRGTHSGVYQTNTSSEANLHVENAKLTDQGTYTCQAVNHVGESAITEMEERDIVLSVYGSPTILSTVAKECSADGRVNITWKPNNQTTSIQHTFNILGLNSTSSQELTFNVTATDEASQIFLPTNLSASTQYEIQIFVCPDECIEKLNDSSSVMTGIGLPGEVTEAEVHQTADTCNVTWSWPITSPQDQIIRFQITAISTLDYVSTGDDVQEMEEINSSSREDLSFPLPTQPNRVYSISIEAITCAGSGPVATANGTCITSRAAPEKVPAPIISPDDYTYSTRQVGVVLPDESNGPVSCLFVILNLGDNSSVVSSYDLDDLQKAQMAAEEHDLQEGTEYLAVAIPRTNFTDPTYSVILGDNSNTTCDVTYTTSQRSRNTENFKGKNWPIEGGRTYSYYTVSSTPISGDEIALQKSQALEFVNPVKPKDPTGWIAAAVICPILLIVAVVLALYYRRRNQPKTDKSHNGVDSGFNMDPRTAPVIPAGQVDPRTEPESPEENPYENVDLKRGKALSETDIPLDQLQERIRLLRADDKELFLEQFHKLKLDAKDMALPITFAKNVALRPKNRYKNVLPYDRTRVHLEGEGLDSYINASYIDGRNMAKKFIATQGAMDSTVFDFWRMVVEQDCRVILMLTKSVEGGKPKCVKYWPKVFETKYFGAISVLNQQEERFGDFIRRTLIVTCNEKRQEIHQYQFINWPDHGIPLTTSDFFRLHTAVMNSQKMGTSTPPIIVHCSAGAGRTGAFIGYDLLMEESLETNHVDVHGCVMNMRQQRNDMVQTCDQYEFLHKILLEACLFGVTDVEAGELLNKRKDDSRVYFDNRSSGKSQIESEFSNLSQAEMMQSEGRRNSCKVIIVREPEEQTSAAINAAHVESYSAKIRMIAAQGPSDATMEYFWRAIIDNEVNTIVMLNMVNGNKAVQYWPNKKGEVMNLSCLSVKLLEEYHDEELIQRKLVVTRRKQTKTITQYHFAGWRPTAPPQNLANLLDLLSKLQPNVDGESVMLVHCSDGLGRTGAFCAVVNLIERLKRENRVDVFRAVKDLRDCRPGMVQTLDQYRLCYDLMLAYLKSINVYSNTEMDQGSAAIYENMN